MIDAIKPDLWDAQRELVLPEYQKLWDNLHSYHALTEPFDGSDVLDLTGLADGTTSSGTGTSSVVTRFGRAFSMDGTGAGIDLGDPTGFRFEKAKKWTVVLLLKHTATGVESLITKWGSGGNQFVSRTTGANPAAITIFHSGAFKYDTPAVLTNDNWYLVVMSNNGASSGNSTLTITIRGYDDAIHDISSNSNISGDSGLTKSIELGSRAGSDLWTGPHAMLGLWTREFTTNDIDLVYANPFGIITYDNSLNDTLVVAAVGGSSDGAAAYYYRQLLGIAA